MEIRKRMHTFMIVICAAACAVTAAAAAPGLSQTAQAEIIHNDFEQDCEGWYGNADSVALSTGNSSGYASSSGLAVTGRSGSGEGAASCEGTRLDGGVEYTYSAMVYSESDETFRLTLRCTDRETGSSTERTLASADAQSGEWTELVAVYAAPADSTDLTLTITTDSTNDFCLDNIRITEDPSSLPRDPISMER